MQTLGEYLKTRRAQLTPADVGVSVHGARRVPGLRREEVAELAGLSVDYYTRLEQGRERHPSSSVLRSITRAFQLGPEAERYLMSLTGDLPAVVAPTEISPHLCALMNDFEKHPAVIINASNDVLAANPLAAAVFGIGEEGLNMARLIFVDRPDGFYRDWDYVADTCVAGMRAATVDTPNDPRLTAVVRELTRDSADFAALWAKAEVRTKTSAPFLIHHPEVGDLDLVYETLRPNSAPGTMLKIYRAEPGSETAAKLQALVERVPVQLS